MVRVFITGSTPRQKSESKPNAVGSIRIGPRVHSGFVPPEKTNAEDSRESSALERKNNTIGRPDAASRRLVTLWCCFDVGNNANIDTKCTPGFRVGCILLCPGCIFNGWGASCRSMNTEPFELHPDIHFVREDQQRRMPLELCKQ